MGVMEKVLFIGNGINRCSNNSTKSWEDLLNVLIEFVEKKGVIKVLKKPFPILYEEIYLRGKQHNRVDEVKILEKIKTEISTFEINEVQQNFSKLGITKFITTNYDYLIEKSLSQIQFKTTQSYGDGVESKYRIRTKNTVENFEVWHIHGELDKTSTIVIGQKMYSEVVGKISDYVEKDMGKSNVISWIDSFFKDKLYFLGYSLSYSDITVWYLLNERVRRIVEGSNLINNDITFYMFVKKKDLETFLEYRSLFEAYKIDLKTNNDNESYKQFYLRALKEIEQDTI